MFTIISLLETLSFASTTFHLDIYQEGFLEGQPVTVTILDSEQQLRRVAENADCVISAERYGNVEHSCLDRPVVGH